MHLRIMSAFLECATRLQNSVQMHICLHIINSLVNQVLHETGLLDTGTYLPHSWTHMFCLHTAACWQQPNKKLRLKPKATQIKQFVVWLLNKRVYMFIHIPCRSVIDDHQFPGNRWVSCLIHNMLKVLLSWAILATNQVVANPWLLSNIPNLLNNTHKCLHNIQ